MRYPESFPTSMYVHIPFCTTKCTYCAFNTYIEQENLIPAFVEALVSEITTVGVAGGRPRLHSIFLGGGTPSLLSISQHEEILASIETAFALTGDCEVTLEANPNDITPTYARGLRAVGYNRVSLGMQTAIASELALFQRRHDNDAVAHAVSALRRAGFDNLNLDLIYGFPHQTAETWRSTLEQALALEPDHLSLYALSLEDGTPLRAWVMTGRLPEPDDDLAADLYEMASAMLDAAGLEQYEISNWARSDKMCRHNLQYWRNLDYVGVGPGAHGFAGGYRYATVLSPQKYIQRMKQPSSRPFPLTPAVDSHTRVDQETEIAELLIMNLRLTREGVDRRTFFDRFGIDLVAMHGSVLQQHQRNGLIDITEAFVRLTDRGRLLSNVVFRDLV
jgi:oxygen-independent coproporphyrinogen-3 oxidase